MIPFKRMAALEVIQGLANAMQVNFLVAIVAVTLHTAKTAPKTKSEIIANQGSDFRELDSATSPHKYQQPPGKFD